MQQSDYIQFTFFVPLHLKHTIENCLGDEVEAFWWDESHACGMIPRDKKEVFNEILQRLSLLPQFFDVADRDWLGENQQILQPLEIGPFFIHGPHYLGDRPTNRQAICIDSPSAFGSGHHPTTASCLETLVDLSVRIKPHSILDLGCGSGLLSIGAALRWEKSKVTAVDCDPESVAAAKTNCTQNSVDRIAVYESEGFSHLALQARAPYDLIIANIHLNPLVSLADDMQKFTVSRGWLVLSGILQTQQDRLLEVYLQKGFSFANARPSGEWVALTLQKN